MSHEDLIVEGQLDLQTAIMQLSAVVLGSTTSMGDVLQRTTQIAKQTIPRVYEVSVTMHARQPRTVATTGEFATTLDEHQYAADAGPCLDAIRHCETVVVNDQLAETRWPEYTGNAIEEGVASSLSVPLQAAGETIAAFNAYALEPHAFDAEAQHVAENLAAYAAVVVNNASLYFDASTRADQMAEAMQSRAVIEQAKGILMGGRHCDADEAFAILVRLSQESHRKLHDVAHAVVEQAKQAK